MKTIVYEAFGTFTEKSVLPHGPSFAIGLFTTVRKAKAAVGKNNRFFDSKVPPLKWKEYKTTGQFASENSHGTKRYRIVPRRLY